MSKNDFCKNCTYPIEKRIMKCMPVGKAVRVTNELNPRLFSVTLISPIMDTILRLNKNNLIPRPEPLNAVYLGGPCAHGGGSKSKSRKKNPNGNKKYMDPWSEV